MEKAVNVHKIKKEKRSGFRKTGASPGAGYIRNPQNVISVVNSLQMKKF